MTQPQPQPQLEVEKLPFGQILRSMTLPQVAAIAGVAFGALSALGVGAYKYGIESEEIRGRKELLTVSGELIAARRTIDRMGEDIKTASDKLDVAMRSVGSLTTQLTQRDVLIADLNERVSRGAGCLYFQQKINEIEKEMAFIRGGGRNTRLSIRGFASDGPEKDREEAAQLARDRADLEQLEKRAIEYSKKAIC